MLRARTHPSLRSGIVVAAVTVLGLVALEQAAGSPAPTKPQVRAHLAALRTDLLATLPVYRKGRYDAVRTSVGNAYFTHFEVLEQPLGRANDTLKETIEHWIATDLRGIAKARRPYAVYRAKVAQVLAKLPAAQRALGA